MFAQISAKPGFVHFLTAIAVIADQNANFAGGFAQARHCPTRSAAYFPIVEADIARATGRRQPRNQAKHRDIAVCQSFNCLCHARMFRRDHRQRINTVAHVQDTGGYGFGGNVIHMFDHNRNPGPRLARRLL